MKKADKFLMNILERIKKYASGIVSTEEVNINENEKQIMQLMKTSNYKELSTDQIIYLQNRVYSNTDLLLQAKLKNAEEEVSVIKRYNLEKKNLLTIKPA